jgi:tRNA wybutosine-synthesizing protein 3
LHILTASLAHAQEVLTAALQAGFRESGALNLVADGPDGPTPIVAVRSTGLALDSVIGQLQNGDAVSIVSRRYLNGLIAVANERFGENSARIARFRNLLLSSPGSRKKKKEEEWEDPSVRRERKRAEGLKRSEEMRANVANETPATLIG